MAGCFFGCHQWLLLDSNYIYWIISPEGLRISHDCFLRLKCSWMLTENWMGGSIVVSRMGNSYDIVVKGAGVVRKFRVQISLRSLVVLWKVFDYLCYIKPGFNTCVSRPHNSARWLTMYGHQCSQAIPAFAIKACVLATKSHMLNFCEVCAVTVTYGNW